MVRPIQLSKTMRRAMERASRLAEPETPLIRAHTVPADDLRGLDPRRFDVRVVITRHDGRPMTAADLQAVAAAFPAKHARKVTPKRAAAQTGTVKRTRRG